MISLQKFLKLLASILAVFFCVIFLDLKFIVSLVLQLPPQGLLLCFVLNILAICTLALRWGRLVAVVVEGQSCASIWQYFHIQYLNLMTPANLGADTFRFIALKNSGLSGRKVFLALLIERYLGLASFLIFSALCLILHFAFDGAYSSWDSNFSLLLAIAVSTGAIVLTLPLLVDFSGVAASTADRLRTEGRYRGILSEILKVAGQVKTELGLSLLAVSFWAASVSVIYASLGGKDEFFLVSYLVPVVEIIRLLPLSIQGIGVREGAFSIAFEWHGLGAELGFSVGLICYACQSLSLLFVSLLGSFTGEAKDET